MADLLLVFHPFSGHRPRGPEAESIVRRLAADGHRVETIATEPGPAFVARLSRRIAELGVTLVVAAGGDGTARDVVDALLERPGAARPSLVLAPMGTANNAARSIDPAPVPRLPGEHAARLARILAAGSERRVDAGSANGVAFFGSVAIGMDADILAWRNRARPRVPSPVGGYPLYLASCAVNALRGHGGGVRMDFGNPAGPGSGAGPGATTLECRAVNVLVTNTALYAGEFRFADGCRHDDGRLDIVVNPSMGDYLRRYAAAWPRHVRASRGLPVVGDAGVRTAARIAMQWARPLAWQVDGEEMPATDRFEIEALPAALRVRVPA